MKPIALLCIVSSIAGSQVLFTDDYETQDLVAWTTSITKQNTGDITAQSATVHSGAWAMQSSMSVTTGTTKAYATHNFAASATGVPDVYIRFYLYIDPAWTQTSGASGDPQIVGIIGVTGSNRLLLRNTAGTWYLRDYYGGVGTTPVSKGVWHAIEMRVVAGAGTAQTTVWLDGAQEVQSNGTQSIGNPYQLQLGIVSTTDTASSGSLYFDDVAASTSAIGAPAVSMTVRRPNSAARTAFPVDVTMFGTSTTDKLIATLGGAEIYRKTGSMTGRERFNVDITALTGPADYTLTVTLTDSADVQKATFSETVRKYKTGTPTVSIDANNSITVDGGRRFLITPYMEDCSSHPCAFDTWWPDWTNYNGWNSGYSASYDVSQYDTYISNLNPSGGGVRTIGPNARFGPITVWSNNVNGVDCTIVSNQNKSPCFSTNQPEATTLAASYASTLKSSPYVLGWAWIDEPDTGGGMGRVPATQLQAMTDAVHDNDPEHPVFLSFYGYNPNTTRRYNMLYNPIPSNAMVSDVYSFDAYPYIYHNSNISSSGLKLSAGGTGYVVGDTGTIDGGNNDAVYQVVSVGPSGEVTNFVLTSYGSGYTATGNTTAIDTTPTTGAGTGFSVRVISVTSGAIGPGQLTTDAAGSYPLTIATWVKLLNEWQRYTYSLTPWMVVIECGKQIGGVGTSDTRTGPMGNQLEMEVWLAIIHGAKGITWWGPEAYVQVPYTGPTMAALKTKIVALNDVIMAPPSTTYSVASNRTVAGSRVDAMLRESGGKVWVIAQRLTDDLADPDEALASALSTQLTISGMTDGTASVYGESRTVSVVDGVITDNFEPYATHIYEITTGPIPFSSQHTGGIWSGGRQ